MTKDDSHFRLRIPTELKERVEISARENKRSMNAEVVALIELAMNNRESFFSGGRDLLELTAKMDAMAKVIRQQIGDEAADEIGI